MDGDWELWPVQHDDAVPGDKEKDEMLTSRDQLILFPADPDDLRALVARYVTWIETGVTLSACLCDWHEKFPVPGGVPVKMLSSVNLNCPVHTKEGFLLGFLDFVKTGPAS